MSEMGPSNNLSGMLMDGPLGDKDDMNFVIGLLEMATQWMKKKYQVPSMTNNLQANQPFHPNGGGMMDYTNPYNVFMAGFGRSTP